MHQLFFQYTEDSSAVCFKSVAERSRCVQWNTAGKGEGTTEAQRGTGDTECAAADNTIGTTSGHNFGN